MAHHKHMGLSDRETQSSLKQSPAPVLFDKRAPAVLNRTPDPLSDSSTNLFLYQTRTVWHKDWKTRDPNRTRINLQIQIKLGWALFVTYTIIQSIMRSEMCSLHLTHPSVHTWSSGQPTVQRPGSSCGLPVVAGIRTHNLGLPRVSSPTLYPLGQRLPDLQRSTTSGWQNYLFSHVTQAIKPTLDKLALWRKRDMQSNVIINRKKMRTHLSVNNTKLGLASCDHT